MPAVEKRAFLATIKMSRVPVRYGQVLADGLSYQGSLRKVEVAFLSLYLNEDTITPIFSTRQKQLLLSTTLATVLSLKLNTFEKRQVS